MYLLIFSFNYLQYYLQKYTIHYTTLLTLLALLTTEYYITFCFPFAHTVLEKKKKKRKNYLLHLYFRYFKLCTYNNDIKVTKMLVFVDLRIFF